MNPPLLSDRTTRVWLVLVVAAGAALRLWGLQFGLPHPFARPDEEVVVDLALGAFKDLNPHFFDWPSFFSYVTAAIYAVMFAVERGVGGSMTSPEIAKTAFEPALHIVPRVLSAVGGIATILVLFGAARELFSRRVAILAAAFLAVAFLHVRDSHFGVTDVPATFLTVCGLWAGLRCFTKGATVQRAAIAGVLCGLAASTKYNCVLILLPAALAILLRADSSRSESVAGAARALVVLCLCAVAAFVAVTPYAVLDYSNFVAAVTGVRRHLANGHVVMARGWTYHARFTLRYGLGIPLMVCGALGVCWLVARERRNAALVLAFPLPYYLILGSGLTVFARYMIPIVPFVCLFAAVAVDQLADGFAMLLHRARASSAAALLLAALVMIPTAIQSIRFDRLMTTTDTRVLAGDWIASTFPSGVSVYQNGLGHAQVQPKPRERYPQYTFNERTNRFERDGQAAEPPEVIVVLESPLAAYTATPAPIAALVAERYTMLRTFEAISGAKRSAAAYDEDDAFFAPFSGIENAKRPGPNIGVYERKH